MRGIRKYLRRLNKEVDSDEKERNMWKLYNEVYDELKKEYDYLGYKMVVIGHLSGTIKKLLERKEYCSVNYYTRNTEKDGEIGDLRDNVKPIAYYATLQNTTFLFDVLYRDNDFVAPHIVKEENLNEYKEA